MEASRAGNLELVKYLILLGANNLNQALGKATILDIMKYLISLGANDFDHAFINAAKSKRGLEGMKFLMTAGLINSGQTILSAIGAALYFGNLKIIKYLISLIPNNLNETLEASVSLGLTNPAIIIPLSSQLKVIKYLIEQRGYNINESLYNIIGIKYYRRKYYICYYREARGLPIITDIIYVIMVKYNPETGTMTLPTTL